MVVCLLASSKKLYGTFGGAVWGTLGGFLGVLGGFLGGSWGFLGGSWWVLGGFLGGSWGLWRALGRFLVVLEGSWWFLGGFLGVVGGGFAVTFVSSGIGNQRKW